MNQFFIKRAEYVEVLIPVGNTRQQIYFPDLPNLRTSKNFGIEAYSDIQQQFSKTGNLVQSITECKNANVVLYFEGGEFIEIPLSSLIRYNSTGVFGSTFYSGNIPMLAGQVIVWAKSYVFLTDPANINAYAGKSFVFNAYYSPNNI
jgi:hypothetical protein